MGFWDINGSPNLGQMTRSYCNQQKKKRTLQNCGICCSGGPQSEIKRMWRDTYLDLARELKMLWNMKVMIGPIVIGALGIVTKRLEQGLENLEIIGRVETIQTTTLLRSARILRRVLETWGDCRTNLSEKLSANVGVKNSQKRTNNDNNFWQNMTVSIMKYMCLVLILNDILKMSLVKEKVSTFLIFYVHFVNASLFKKRHSLQTMKY